jgi:hypothetical protein
MRQLGGTVPTYSAMVGYHHRLHPLVVVEPRAMLGLTGEAGYAGDGDERAAMEVFAGSTKLEGQVRVLAFPVRPVFVGASFGVGFETCAEISIIVGVSARCVGGPIATAALEVGVLISDRIQLGIAVHPLALAVPDADRALHAGNNRPITPIGFTFSYHL